MSGPTSQASDVERLVVAEQVRALYAKAVVPFLTVVLNGSVVAYVVRGSVPDVCVAVWLASMLVVAGARVVLLLAYKRRAPADAMRWGKAFAVGAAMNGVVWGSSAALIYPSGQPALQVFLLFVLGGMTAGATASTASFGPAFPAFAVPALLPMTLRLASEGSPIHLAMAGMTAVFAAAMWTLARGAGRSFADSTRLRIEKTGLAADLEAAQGNLKEVLRGLEVRVAERTAELEAQKETLQTIFDHAPVMLAVYGEDGRIQLANGTLDGGHAVSIEDYVAARLAPGCEVERGVRTSVRQHLFDGNGAWRDFALGGRAGFQRYFTLASVRLSQGLFVAIGQDTTERKRTEERLALSERMVSVGTLAAGVGHEINNPLAFVLSNQEFVEQCVRTAVEATAAKRGDDALSALRAIAEPLKDARAGARRVAEIVADLKTLSRTGEDADGSVDLCAVLETCLRMSNNELRHRARVVCDLAPVPPVGGNEGRLVQVFLNILLNAAQAMPEGAAANNEVRVATRTDAKGRAVVEIADTGRGIPKEALPRIFEPFFTTKPVGKGTGLGLSICHTIVTALGGEIEVESDVGKGSVFRIVLPGLPREARDPASGSEPPPSSSHVSPRLRILVVDDDRMVGTALKRSLQSRHEMSVEVSARAALARFEAGERFDVVLCDVMMADMNGIEFYEELSRRDADQGSRVVFMTGGAFTENARTFLDGVPNARFSKPWKPGELLALVQAVGSTRSTP
jgi:signal transduction histidine kinase